MQLITRAIAIKPQAEFFINLSQAYRALGRVKESADACAHALQLGPGATARSSTLPVNLLDPWIRLFARSAGANGSLLVQVQFRGLLGNLTGLLNVGSLSPSGYSSWQPTQRVLSALALPLLTTSAQVLLTSRATSGSWQVDDVYLDPCVAKLG